MNQDPAESKNSSGSQQGIVPFVVDNGFRNGDSTPHQLTRESPPKAQLSTLNSNSTVSFGTYRLRLWDIVRPKPGGGVSFSVLWQINPAKIWVMAAWAACVSVFEQICC